MGTVIVSCSCGRQLTIDSALEGNPLRCPTCGLTLTVPSAAAYSSQKMPWLDMKVATTAALAGAAAPQRQRLPVWMIISAAGLAVVVLSLIVPWILYWRGEFREEQIARQ